MATKKNSVRTSGPMARKASKILRTSQSKTKKALAGSVLSNSKRTNKR